MKFLFTPLNNFTESIIICFRFHPNNVLKVRTLADSLGCYGLITDTNRYIAQFFPDISLSEDFLNLSISELIDIVNKDELQASEEQVTLNLFF